MTSSSKVKGNTFERAIVNTARDMGLEAQRAYASDGRALGEVKEVDVLVGGVTIQAKRRAKLADYMQIPDNVDIVVMRGDRGDSYAVVRFEKVLQLISDGKWHK